jgi:hypothetical protein
MNELIVIILLTNENTVSEPVLAHVETFFTILKKYLEGSKIE